MPQRNQNTLTFSIEIERPVAEVFAHLSDPRNFLGLQPLLIGISDVAETTENGVTVRRYTTTEEFKFAGIFTYHNHIRVDLRLTRPPNRLDAHVESPGNVTLDVEYHLTETARGARLEEIMHIQSPGLVTGFVLSEATKAQQTVMARLKARMEGQPTG